MVYYMEYLLFTNRWATFRKIAFETFCAKQISFFLLILLTFILSKVFFIKLFFYASKSDRTSETFMVSVM